MNECNPTFWDSGSFNCKCHGRQWAPNRRVLGGGSALDVVVKPSPIQSHEFIQLLFNAALDKKCSIALLMLLLCSHALVFFCRPDMTSAVDWALKINHLSILGFVFFAPHKYHHHLRIIVVSYTDRFTCLSFLRIWIRRFNLMWFRWWSWFFAACQAHQCGTFNQITCIRLLQYISHSHHALYWF